MVAAGELRSMRIRGVPIGDGTYRMDDMLRVTHQLRRK